MWVHARHKQRIAKAALELIQSKVQGDMRSFPEKHPGVFAIDSKGDPKVTDKAVESALYSNLEIREAKDSYINSCSQVDAAEILKSSFEQKKGSLDNEVKLHINEFIQGKQTDDVDAAASVADIVRQRKEKDARGKG